MSQNKTLVIKRLDCEQVHQIMAEGVLVRMGKSVDKRARVRICWAFDKRTGELVEARVEVET